MFSSWLLPPSMDTTTLSVLAPVLFLCWLTSRWVLSYLDDRRRYGHLPGPSPLLRLPLVGHSYLLSGDPIAALCRMRSRYGDVFRLDAVGCSLPSVVVCSHRALAEASGRDDCAGRHFHRIPLFNWLMPEGDDGRKIVSVAKASGAEWWDQRRYILRTLGDLGMGKRDTMEDIIGQESRSIIQTMLASKGRPIQMRGFFLSPINNVISRIMTGRRSRHDDPDLVRLTGLIIEYLDHVDFTRPFNLLQFNCVPFARLCSFLGVRNLLDATADLKRLFREEIDLQEADAEGSYISRTLAEMERSGEDVSACWNKVDGIKRLEEQMIELFAAGTDTTATFLEWALLYMSAHPETQRRVQDEIDWVVARKTAAAADPAAAAEEEEEEGSVALSDRGDMPYTEATIEEMSRLTPEGAIIVPRMALADTRIGGQPIPAGTVVVPFVWGMNRDPEHFGPDPDLFDPERFLQVDGDGGGGYRFKKHDRVLFFGTGKRRCIGEVLAKAEVFLIFTAILQKFTIVPECDPKELDFSPELSTLFYPKPYNIFAKPRS